MKDYKRSLSQQTLSFIKDKSKVTIFYGKHMATYVSTFTMLMKTCKGRDKICSIFQYVADFYYNCNKYSEIPQVLEEFRAGLNTGANVAFKLRSTMKNTRKIFKFLKFIDQISSIVKNIESKKPIYLKIIIILENLMAFFSNLFDNIIWGINTEVLDIWFSNKAKKFKANKYFFSLLKIIFKMLANNYKHHLRIKSMKQILTQLKNYKQQQISSANRSYHLCKQYLKHRFEVRVQQIDGAIMIFRIVMLIRKLKLPGYTFVTKILYSVCGLITTFLSAYKMILDQPVLVQLKEKQINKNQQYDRQGRFETIEGVKRVNIGRTGSLQFI